MGKTKRDKDEAQRRKQRRAEKESWGKDYIPPWIEDDRRSSNWKDT